MKNSASNSVIFPFGLSGVAQTTTLHNAWTSMGDEGPAETQIHYHAPNISHRSHLQLYHNNIMHTVDNQIQRMIQSNVTN